MLDVRLSADATSVLCRTGLLLHCIHYVYTLCYYLLTTCLTWNITFTRVIQIIITRVLIPKIFCAVVPVCNCGKNVTGKFCLLKKAAYVQSTSCRSPSLLLCINSRNPNLLIVSKNLVLSVVWLASGR